MYSRFHGLIIVGIVLSPFTRSLLFTDGQCWIPALKHTMRNTQHIFLTVLRLLSLIPISIESRQNTQRAF